MEKINEIRYSGKVSREPETKTFASGKKLITWGMSVYAGKDREGQHQNAYIQVKCWGDKAPAKGQGVLIVGKLGAEVWQRDGQPQSKMTLVCNGWESYGDEAKGGDDDLPF